jgi:hypothetical protein
MSQPCGSVSLPADTAMQQQLPAVLVEVVVAVADTLCLPLNRNLDVIQVLSPAMSMGPP